MLLVSFRFIASLEESMAAMEQMPDPLARNKFLYEVRRII